MPPLGSSALDIQTYNLRLLLEQVLHRWLHWKTVARALFKRHRAEALTQTPNHVPG